MGKVRDLILTLDWEGQPTHTVIYDPEEETKEMSGQNGNYDVIRVIEDGRQYYLQLSNKSLLNQLVKIDKPSQLKITRSGSSFATKFEVVNMGAPNPKLIKK